MHIFLPGAKISPYFSFSVMIMILFWIFLLLTAAAFGIAYYCFHTGFLADPPKKLGPEEFDLPEGEIYEVYWESMKKWTRETRSTPHETFTIKSFDGLTLCGDRKSVV